MQNDSTFQQIQQMKKTGGMDQTIQINERVMELEMKINNLSNFQTKKQQAKALQALVL